MAGMEYSISGKLVINCNMKKYVILIFLGINCITGHSCRKQQAINDVLGQYIEAGNYQLVFYEGYPPEFNIDSPLWHCIFEPPAVRLLMPVPL
jgi:hypothetical protein